MPSTRLGTPEQRFQERILVQLRSRYAQWQFQPAPEGMAVLARRSGSELQLSLDTLYAESQRDSAALPERISRFVADLGPRLSAAELRPELAARGPDPEALVWCVRTERSLRAYSRFAELATRELPGGLLAFVAESLPGEAMRGVSRPEAEAGGLSAEALAGHAERNTALRLGRWRSALEPGSEESWLLTDDTLFSSSLLVVPEFLRALAERGGGEAALAAPDRAMVVAAVAAEAAPERFRAVVRRLFRLASNPLSPVLLSTDGASLRLHPAERREPLRGWRRLLQAWPD